MAYADSFRANPHWLPRQKRASLRAIQGEDGLPFVGNTFRMLRDPAAFGKRMIEAYGPVFRNHAFGGPTVSLMGPDANELVLFDRDRAFSSFADEVRASIAPIRLPLPGTQMHRGVSARAYLSVCFCAKSPRAGRARAMTSFRNSAARRARTGSRSRRRRLPTT